MQQCLLGQSYQTISKKNNNFTDLPQSVQRKALNRKTKRQIIHLLTNTAQPTSYALIQNKFCGSRNVLYDMHLLHMILRSRTCSWINIFCWTWNNISTKDTLSLTVLFKYYLNTFIVFIFIFNIFSLKFCHFYYVLFIFVCFFNIYIF